MYIIAPDATSQSILVKLVNSSTGLGLTGLTFETASLTCYYKRGATGTSTAITLATQTPTGAYSSGGFCAIDGTYQPGVYRLDVPDAVVATGVQFAVITFQGAASLKDETVSIQLLAVFDTSSDTVTLASGTHTGAVIPTVTTVGSVTGAVGSVTGAVGSVTGNVGGNVAGSVASVTGAVGSVTGNVGGNVAGSVASVTGAVGSVTGAVGSVTGNVGGNVTGTVGSLAAQAKADVNAEVLDVIATDTIAELATDPGATPTVAKALMLLYMALRNAATATASAATIKNNAGATVLTKALSDDSTTFTAGKVS